MFNRSSICLVCSVFGILSGADGATANGKIWDASGDPVEHATVLVYSAGVRHGYSVYCPTCWVDCGKKALTDASGNFSIAGLSPDLVFKLLVLHEGFSPEFIPDVDPEKGPSKTAVLKARKPVEDLTRVLRGRVVDLRGEPIPDAVIEQWGVLIKSPEGRVSQRFGPTDWTDLMAVTNPKGEFEIAYDQAGLDLRMIVLVSGRGLAPKLVTEHAGAERKTIMIGGGATIRGRLVQNGKPVPGASIGLSSHSNNAATYMPAVQVGTKEDGTFVLQNVPAGRVWFVYPRMESIASRGYAELVECATKDDGQDVNVGDIEIKPGFTLKGRVVLPQEKPLPEGMRVLLGADRSFDNQTIVLPPDGHFAFQGLGRHIYTVRPMVKGYTYGDGNPLEVLVEPNGNEVVLELKPAQL